MNDPRRPILRLSRRLPPRPPEQWSRYERLKHEWIAAHPDATADEYELAMREIARELGL